MGEITDVLAELLVMLKDGLVMVNGEIPALVTDFINWGIASESIEVFVILMIIIAAFKLASVFNGNYVFFSVLNNKMTEENEENFSYGSLYREAKEAAEEAVGWIIAKYVAYVVAFFFTLVLMGEIMDVIKIMVAPRIYLIETITDLLKPTVQR